MTETEYSRKMKAAAALADAAWLRGGLEAMHEELRSLHRTEACPVLIAEFRRLYHKQCRSLSTDEALKGGCHG